MLFRSVKLGHVAIDGTKLKANASKHKAMSYDRMEGAAQRLRQEVEELLRSAAAADEAEDAQHGKGKRGDELPAELARRESRLIKIRAAKAELEQEAKEKADQQQARRPPGAGGANGEKSPWAGTEGAGSGTGKTGSESATELHRSGEPHHAR